MFNPFSPLSSPTSGANVYAVIFDTATDQIAIQHWTDFDFGTSSISRGLIDGYLAATAKVVSFSGGNARRAHKRRSMLYHGREGL